LPAELRHGNYRLSQQFSINVLTNLVHHARDFITHDAWLGRAVGIEALTREYVGEVKTGSAHRDAHFIGVRVRVGLLFNAKHVNAAVSCRDDLAHGLFALRRY
jgi:hypothetical protein